MLGVWRWEPHSYTSESSWTWRWGKDTQVTEGWAPRAKVNSIVTESRQRLFELDLWEGTDYELPEEVCLDVSFRVFVRQCQLVEKLEPARYIKEVQGSSDGERDVCMWALVKGELGWCARLWNKINIWAYFHQGWIKIKVKNLALYSCWYFDGSCANLFGGNWHFFLSVLNHECGISIYFYFLWLL